MTVVDALTRSAFVTRPVAVNDPVTVRPASVPTDVNDEVTTFEASVVPVRVPAGAMTTAVDAAVIKPLPLTVNTGIAVEDPNEPTFEFTVASVVAKLFADQDTSPVPAPVCSTATEKASVEPSVIPVAFASEPVALPTRLEAATCWNLA